MDQKDKALVVATICVIAFIVVGIFLAYNFQQIDKRGVACMKEPLLYAENRMLQDTGEDHSCQCVLSENSLNPGLNFIP